MLNTLRYAKEVHQAADFDLPTAGAKAAGVSVKELELAKRLIDDMTEDWKVEKFKDTFHEDLMHRIEEKIRRGQTKEITEPDESGRTPRRSAEIINLADLLRSSLAKGGRNPGQRAAPNTTAQRAAPKTAAKPNPRARPVSGRSKAPAGRKRA